MFFTFTWSKTLGYISWLPSLSVWKDTMIYLVFPGDDFTVNLQEKLVDWGTLILSHCLILNPTGTFTFFSIISYSRSLGPSAGRTWGTYQDTLLRVIFPAIWKMHHHQTRTNVKTCLNPYTTCIIIFSKTKNVFEGNSETKGSLRIKRLEEITLSYAESRNVSEMRSSTHVL